jgi:hypothetical protein
VEAIDEERVREFANDIDLRLSSGGGTVEEVVAYLGGRLRRDFGAPGLAQLLSSRLRELELAKARYQRKSEQVETFRRPALRANGREKWYLGPGDHARTWAGMLDLLRKRKRREEVIAEVDRASTGILSLTDRPSKAQFKTHGLVVGHVQSGKTQGMAALLAKAAATEYTFFIVLAGMTNVLRKQTQDRLQSDLIDLDPGHWYSWTSADADFVENTGTAFQFEAGRSQLAVIKKNAGVLRRLRTKLLNSPEMLRQGTVFMIIDDECDQASVNASKYDEQMTAINRLIRELIEMLPRVAYVGFTATPFANVLISPVVQKGKLPDLYPKDFIFPMSAPDEYFGAEKLFGRSALGLEGYDDETEGFDMIRIIPDAELVRLRPASAKDRNAFAFEVTDSLSDAIGYFLLCVAARFVRGQRDQHSSMLVHTTYFMTIHSQIESAINVHLDFVRRQHRSGSAALRQRLERIWEAEHRRVPSAGFGLKPLTFEEVHAELRGVLAEIEVKVENSTSVSRLDYRDDYPRRYIVVGGNVLARGLTVEGLMVSYFLRTSSQYDTLMQMGRWFGYRPGYEDLPRIWMEDDLRQAFRDLAAVEAEMRMAMQVYHEQDVTPLEFAVKIKQIPGMAITAKNKMRHATTCEVSYGGTQQQTIRFRRDRDWLASNWRAGSALIDATIGKRISSGVRPGCHVFVGVEAGDIIRFLEHYCVHSSQLHMEGGRMAEYIRKMIASGRSLLSHWNVAVIGPQTGPQSELPLGQLGPITTNIRSRINEAGGDADIKALMSMGDVLVDDGSLNAGSWAAARKLRSDHGKPPLLLLYPINRDSPPSGRNGGTRYALDAEHDVLGIGVLFPSFKGDADYVSVVLPETEPDEDDEQIAELLDVDPVRK